MGALFPKEQAARILASALDEDLGADGDVTTRALAKPADRGEAWIVAREEMVVAGLPLLPMIAREMEARGEGALSVETLVEDGAHCRAGGRLARLEGSVRALLASERVLLNLLARLCGIASMTRKAVEEIAGTDCTIADTRKTTPGLRALEKYAVAVGGGENHRSALDEMVMVKDNHRQLCGGLSAVLDAMEAAGHDLAKIEVEVESSEDLDLALERGVGWILLDNMSVLEMRTAVKKVAGRARLEASGGLTIGRLRDVAEAGVQRISLGSLTHSARSLDIGLDILHLRCSAS